MKLGVASASIMYYMAEQFMSHKKPFILENNFENAVVSRGMDSYVGNGPQIVVDTTDFNTVDKDDIVNQILKYKEQLYAN